MTNERHPERPPFGFNVIGYVTGNLGMGVSTRNTLGVLTERGLPLVALNCDAFSGHIGPDRTRSGIETAFADLEPRPRALPYGINLYHVNPPAIRSIWLDGLAWHRRSTALNVCVPFWELETLPSEWVDVLAAMDVVLAPTLFIQQAVTDALPDCRCIHYPQAVYIPEAVTRDRSRWGFGDDETVFVSSFDVSSGFGRKNPWAVIDAFLSAFPGRGGEAPDGGKVRLVVKTNPFAGKGAAELSRLREIAARDARLVVMEQALAYAEVLSLYASADVLVSLHRSEGLGLNMMEAMSLGTPVIATAWSGNMDFTTAENSCLVGYDFVGLNADEANYPASEVGPRARWADPRVEEAASCMRRLAEDPGLRSRLGERGRSDMQERLARYRRGEIFDRLQALYETDDALWSAHGAKLRELRRLGSTSPYRFARRRAGLALRSLGLWR